MEQEQKNCLERVIDGARKTAMVGLSSTLIGMSALPLISPAQEPLKSLPTYSEDKQTRKDREMYALGLVFGGMSIAYGAMVLGSIAASIDHYKKQRRKED